MSESPYDPSFLSSVSEPLASILAQVLPLKSSSSDNNNADADTAAAMVDHLEIRVRRHTLSLLTAKSLTELSTFWREFLDVCLHIVATQREEPYPRISPALRKLPYGLLEDILDGLSLADCQTFWQDTLEPASESLFSKALWWDPPNVSFLPFLKVCNKLLKRQPSWGYRVMKVLAEVYPLNEKSAVRLWGSRNTDNELQLEEDDETTEAKKKQEGTSSSIPDYNLYQSFWSLQEEFKSPYIKNLASFLVRLRTFLQALENAPVEDSAPAPTSPIYLTARRLLPLQLSDPTVRIHVLTQFLIVAHHLSLEAPAVGTQLADLQYRATQLVQELPHGPAHWQLLKSILESSELQWRDWKKNKFQPDLDAKPGANDVVDDDRSRKRKRRTTTTAVDNDELPTDTVPSDLPTMTQKMKRPTYVPFLSDYVDALDPDAGIEPEYHPKNDALFAWRALRLLAQEHMDDFQRILPNGDFEGVVRHVYEGKGVDIPGEAPTHEADDHDDEDDAPVEVTTTEIAKAEEEAVHENDEGHKEDAMEEELVDEEHDETHVEPNVEMNDVNDGSPKGAFADQQDEAEERQAEMDTDEPQEGSTKDEGLSTSRNGQHNETSRVDTTTSPPPSKSRPIFIPQARSPRPDNSPPRVLEKSPPRDATKDAPRSSNAGGSGSDSRGPPQRSSQTDGGDGHQGDRSRGGRDDRDDRQRRPDLNERRSSGARDDRGPPQQQQQPHRPSSRDDRNWRDDRRDEWRGERPRNRDGRRGARR